MRADSIAAYLGFTLHNYKRAGDGVLICSGSGLMMALMDAVPRFNYCIDIDNHRDITTRVPNLMAALDLNCNLTLMGVAGWFSVDTPDALIDGMQRVHHTQVVSYLAGINHPASCLSLKFFVEKCNALLPLHN